jgi:hypothetical protein
VGLGGGLVKATDQILEYLDGPKREDRYHRTALDDMKLGDVTTGQLGHYLACRRVMEEHLDEETVFDELCRLSRQADDETCDAFARITNGEFDRRRAEKLVFTAVNTNVDTHILVQIAYGMLRDGWAEHQVEYALGTLDAA